VESVFVVQHSYVVGECEEIKFIGVYKSRKDAEETVKRLRTLPGFRDKADGFSIDKYEVNVDQWGEGFKTK